MKIKNILFSLVLLQSVTSTAWAQDHEHHHHGHHGDAKAKETGSKAVSTDSLYNAEMKFQDQNGKSITFSSLRGEPMIISMAYTGCTYTCPMILSQMQQIEKKLIANGKKNVRFVLVSFDHKRDTPKVLSQFAEKRGLGKSWQLLTAKSDKEPRTIANLLGIQYQQTSTGDFDHSFIISAVDKGGIVVSQQIGAKEESDKLIKALNL